MEQLAGQALVSPPLCSQHPDPWAVFNLLPCNRVRGGKDVVITVWSMRARLVFSSSGCRFGCYFPLSFFFEMQFRARGKSQVGTEAVASLGNHFCLPFFRLFHLF